MTGLKKSGNIRHKDEIKAFSGFLSPQKISSRIKLGSGLLKSTNNRPSQGQQPSQFCISPVWIGQIFLSNDHTTLSDAFLPVRACECLFHVKMMLFVLDENGKSASIFSEAIQQILDAHQTLEVNITVFNKVGKVR